MVTITFTQTDNGSASESVEASVVYGTEFMDSRKNQSEHELVDGSTIVYDAGPTWCHGVLVLKHASYSDGAALRAWIRDSIIFAFNRFTISAVSGADFGLGKGVVITNARYDGGSNMDGVFQYIAPDMYNIKFPYRFVRS